MNALSNNLQTVKSQIYRTTSIIHYLKFDLVVDLYNDTFSKHAIR